VAQAYNVYEEGCPTRQVLARLADKWAMLIINRLHIGPVRFNQLRRDIKGISQKVLSQELKKLQRDGLIDRTVRPTVPVSVEYTLTQLGQTLIKPVSELTHWVEGHMDAVLAAQSAYDAAAAECE
jgi:DNA-binding HxlR family transcriptional regulator